MQFRCKRCLYDNTIPDIYFDSKGICNYCHIHDKLEVEYPTGKKGKKILNSIFNRIKFEGRNKKYDCVVGISGGCDSSYLLYKVKNSGLRPLAVHFDNTWDSTVAVENINKILNKLNVDLFTYVVNNKEYDDIYRSFFKAGVSDIETPTDIALAVVLNIAAEKYGVKYVIEGHNFRSEGIAPLGWIYMDGKYINSIQKKFGTYKLDTFPNLSMLSFLRWMLFKRIRKIRPLWYLDYKKEDVKSFLKKEFDWQWYGGHHLENRFTAFWHSYFLPIRYGRDCRVLGYSALIRSGQMDREEGLRLIDEPFHMEPGLLDYVKKRLELSDREFQELMDLPKKTFMDYKTYKKVFELMKPFFWIMYKSNLVPKSFYIKYCHRMKNNNIVTN